MASDLRNSSCAFSVGWRSLIVRLQARCGELGRRVIFDYGLAGHGRTLLLEEHSGYALYDLFENGWKLHIFALSRVEAS